MRAYTLAILAQCTQSGDTLATDKDIVEWANKKVIAPKFITSYTSVLIIYYPWFFLSFVFSWQEPISRQKSAVFKTHQFVMHMLSLI